MNKADVTKTLDQILDGLEDKYKADAMALYYAYCKHLYTDDYSLLPVPSAAQYLSMSEHRVRKARQILLQQGIISSKVMQDKEGVVRHFVELHHL